MTMIDVSQWREAAARARKDARRVTDPVLIAGLARIAEQYEKLAVHAEGLLTAVSKPENPTDVTSF